MMSSTIRAIFFFVISLYLVVSKCNGEGYERAPNCAQNICPAYTVVFSNKEFEIRNYTKALWVHTKATTSYELATTKYFEILSSYYDGKNDHNMKIKKTYPILVVVENSTYTLYFYLPQPFAPRPVTPGAVEIDELPRRQYAAVRRFDGKISDDVIKAEVDALKQSLQTSPYKRPPPFADFMVATYNSPADVTDRVNEVFLWFD
ncbi:hypothetical protein C2S53_011570 [Perilla frutescens var. hirtella]|uniref:Heme-binding protein 2 n=1 Tax=Perilla frutescens var. hirtella TaxID=608512 RepID=A0AAD4P7Q8_PERFH|nr:hypothetical protein C2S53_011570 [Perilla frutescens var. hirtella]